MFIKKLVLKNFTSHKETTLDLDKLTVIRGSNAVGKSSIEQAISLMFTGRSESTNDAGTGRKDLIRKGEEKCLVSAKILIDGQERELRMSLTEKSDRTLTAKRADDPSWTGSELLDYLKINRDVLSCLCNGRYFIEMDEAEQKDFLAGIVLPKTYAWDHAILADCSSAGFHTDWSGAPFDIIDIAYSFFYDRRKSTNAAIKAWVAPEPLSESALKVDEIRTRLAERQSQRTNLSVQRSGLLSDYEKHQQAIAKLAGRKQSLTDKLAKCEQQKAASNVLTEKRLKEQQKIADQSAKAKELDEDCVAIKERLAVNKADLDALEGLAESPSCPTCHRLLDEDALMRIGAPLVVERDKLIANQQKAWDARKALGDFEGAKRAIAAHEQSLRDLKTIEANIAKYKAELETIPDDASATPPDTSAIDVQIADIDQRIAKGNAALYEAGQQDAKKKEHERLTAQKKALDSQLVRLEKLVEYFGPNGIKSKLLHEHVAGFEAAMNLVLGRWGYWCELSFDPYLLVVHFGANEGTWCYSLRTLSQSQRYRFATAFQLALAQVTGIKFCVIDGADILDTSGRQELFRALRESELDQVIVCQTDERTQVPKAPGVVFYGVSMTLESGVPTSKVDRL